MLKKIYRKAHRIVSRALYTDRKIEEMIQSEDPVISKMGKTFQEALNGNLSREEEKYVHQIEDLRSYYIRSNEFIEIDETNKMESISELARVSSKKKNWGILISKLIDNFTVKNALELGTCIGISTSYHAFALQKNSGKVLTLEGSNNRIHQAKKTFSKLSLSNIEIKQGNFENTLPEALNSDTIFDYAFIDGDHRYESTLGNFKKILEHIEGQAIILVDDIQWSLGMKKAWKEITEHEESKYVFDLFNVGIIIKGDEYDHVKIRLALW